MCPIGKSESTGTNQPYRVILSEAGSSAKRMTWRSRRTPTLSTLKLLQQGILSQNTDERAFNSSVHSYPLYNPTVRV